MNHIKTDICVIGGGSGGLSVAAGAVQMGARVVLVEGHKMGGDCLNYGCVPSKALLAQAKGVKARGAPPRAEDFSAAMAHVHATIAAIAPHDSVERFEGLGVQVIEGFARFTGADTVVVGETTISARRFVIATGSRAFVPPIKGLEDVPYMTNETLFEQTECPSHLLIIGAGPIGLEMAQAHRRLGARVTVIEGATALGRDDPEAAAVVLDQLRSEGVEIIEQAQVEQVSGRAGAIEVQVKGGTIFVGTHLLVAVGRAPNVEKLDLAKAGIRHTQAGITVDARLRSSNRRVYAIGDVAGQGQFTHLAGYHAGVVIRSVVFGLPAKARHDHIPHVTFTDPELAHIGLTEAAARKRYGGQVSIHKIGYDQIDRAQAEGWKTGFIKLMAVRGRPVGVTIVGTQAGEVIAPYALAMANNLKLSAVAGTVLPYPTLAEIGKRAAGAYFSPKLFDSINVKRFVGLVQRWLP
ncbi:dihydrolipoyl dehydrogenase family protein [Roseinatronobacter bogoriensis]|uniref:Dihydrolipoamide dehydrogenase n=1 Tax=Roseinatronobacter bogoriensis subsp. barguzinensis TaxID=441209 RepID=A0A2K8KEL3_9RHOB|nr:MULTISPECIES: FAD-dependent oxidoreductase [Rhodobaca]ATX65208.1 dihydrolipoamide dehydrogenase [Rhodobaca barguzinensis]MBB4209301.1 pyruvate/2-oxoglutarate dehydrogenase complex dihydrolipoamide dehydrogenase (E3) component [Rhodobaca bogoriensis DSM 18756]TDW34364.1 pyruvate/2-oxoglutarate dehydrogenase complex dihydrolipoamide dehydrogenase (E3) component [Rhodobaca barguzinensis]TDY67045.1 pyruvate/2-oxoglutarate dehydrogenase complex dihydrolipoamide dehydrogenase (E3) component [Rhodo